MLQQRKTPPSPEELEIAQGKKKLDAEMAKKYLEQLEQITNSIRDMFERQVAEAEVRFKPHFD